MTKLKNAAMFWGLAAAMGGLDSHVQPARELTREQIDRIKQKRIEKALASKERNYKRQGLTRFIIEEIVIWALNETSARIKYSKLVKQ